MAFCCLVDFPSSVLQAEVEEGISQLEKGGMRGNELVKGVLSSFRECTGLNLQLNH